MRFSVLIGVASAMAAHLCAPLTAQQSGDSLVARGDTAPLFILKNMAGDSVRLADFAGHPVLLDFWASWCPPCRE